MSTRKKYVLGIGLFSLAVLCTVWFCLSKYETINVTILGSLYDMTNEGTAVPCNISVDGKYCASALQENSFSGEMRIEADQLELKIKIIELNFSDGVAVPVVEDELGYQYTSRIHSIIKRKNSSEFVIVLYNEYKIAEDKLIASIDETNPLFICTEKMSKNDALDLIYSHFR